VFTPSAGGVRVARGTVHNFSKSHGTRVPEQNHCGTGFCRILLAQLCLADTRGVLEETGDCESKVPI